MRSKNVVVIAVCGPHGVGKTYLTGKLRNKYKVLEEGFVPSNREKLFHPQSFVMEDKWKTEWFERMRDTVSSHDDGTVLITDRGPYSACVYSKKNGNLMKDTIKQLIRDHRDKGIHIYCVLIMKTQKEIMKQIEHRIGTIKDGVSVRVGD